MGVGWEGAASSGLRAGRRVAYRSGVAQNETFLWTESKSLAAQLLAEDDLTDAQIAEQCDVARATLNRWKREPEFRARIKELLVDIRADILSRGVARQETRLKALHYRWTRLQALIAKQLASDSPDAKLLKELREHEKQAAQELGQWVEKRESSVTMELVEEIVDSPQDIPPLSGASGVLPQ